MEKNLNMSPCRHLSDQHHHQPQSRGSLPTKKERKRLTLQCFEHKGFRAVSENTWKETRGYTFSAHNLLNSAIFFTWLSIKLWPPNPGFTDIINTRSTTAWKKKWNIVIRMSGHVSLSRYWWIDEKSSQTSAKATSNILLQTLWLHAA